MGVHLVFDHTMAHYLHVTCTEQGSALSAEHPFPVTFPMPILLGNPFPTFLRVSSFSPPVKGSESVGIDIAEGVT